MQRSTTGRAGVDKGDLTPGVLKGDPAPGVLKGDPTPKTAGSASARMLKNSERDTKKEMVQPSGNSKMFS